MAVERGADGIAVQRFLKAATAEKGEDFHGLAFNSRLDGSIVQGRDDLRRPQAGQGLFQV